MCIGPVRDVRTGYEASLVVERPVPVNTKHLHNICTMLAQRLRRWPNIVQMSYKCFVFAGTFYRRCIRFFIQAWLIRSFRLTATTSQHWLNAVPTSQMLEQRSASIMSATTEFIHDTKQNNKNQRTRWMYNREHLPVIEEVTLN